MKLNDTKAALLSRKKWNPEAVTQYRDGACRIGYLYCGHFKAIAEGKTWEQALKRLPKPKRHYVANVPFPPAV